MKLENVKIGMKVVPHKYGGCPLEVSCVWREAEKIGQKYLYVNHINKDIVLLLHEKQNRVNGDYYWASDFEPYIEEPELMNFEPNKKYTIRFLPKEEKMKVKLLSDVKGFEKGKVYAVLGMFGSSKKPIAFRIGAPGTGYLDANLFKVIPEPKFKIGDEFMFVDKDRHIMVLKGNLRKIDNIRQVENNFDYYIVDELNNGAWFTEETVIGNNNGITWKKMEVKMGSNFKVGDIVKIIDADYGFSTYLAYFNQHNIAQSISKRFKEGRRPENGAEGVILFIGNHMSKSYSEVIVVETKAGEVYLMGPSGIKKVDITDLSILKQKYVELGKEIEKLEMKQKEEVDYALKLEVTNSNSLAVGYYVGKKYFAIGYITSKGECSFLANEAIAGNYEIWRDHGMKICFDRVEWRNKIYFITDQAFLRFDDVRISGSIYDFNNTNYSNNCKDGNIIRHKHNNCPIGF